MEYLHASDSFVCVWQVINPAMKSKKKKYTNSGVVSESWCKFIVYIYCRFTAFSKNHYVGTVDWSQEIHTTFKIYL